MNEGMLFLVVGPSGAGKDTLLDAARSALAADPSYVFTRRIITRAEKAGGEAHTAATPQQFQDLVNSGALMLHWHAHGLSYGIPTSALDALNDGRNVVVNGSRSILDIARAKFPRLRIVSVAVSEESLQARLQARGRETDADIASRMARASEFTVQGSDVVTVHNNGTIEEGQAKFLSALRSE